MTNLVHSFEPPQIRDWPKRPYRTIFIVIIIFKFLGIFIVDKWNFILRHVVS